MTGHLRPGERLVDGEPMYSAAWLDDRPLSVVAIERAQELAQLSGTHLDVRITENDE
jgi:hypothetical protein